MTATTQLVTDRRSLSTPNSPILPDKRTFASELEGTATAAGGARIYLPMIVIGLGVALTSMWVTFLVWEAAATIATVVT
jgi:hypothetical protein